MQETGKQRPYLLWVLIALLVAGFAYEVRGPVNPSWVDAATLGLIALVNLMLLHRQLPWQNILPAAFITAAIGTIVHGTSVHTAIPLGPIVFNSGEGPALFTGLPWFVPLLWVAAVFTARGVGRLILRPWRKVKSYGYWLIGITALLVTAFDLALEPYAWHARHLWLWQPTRLTVSWHGASPLCIPGWGLTALLILMFITPSLIRKQPGNSSGADYHPLWIWLAMLLVFAVGAANASLWWSVLADGVIASVTATFAIRGGQW